MVKFSLQFDIDRGLAKQDNTSKAVLSTQIIIRSNATMVRQGEKEIKERMKVSISQPYRIIHSNSGFGTE
jgi:hypothetical protein